MSPSEEHRLRIDFVDAPGGGRIGLCPCPGARRRFAAGRDPGADVEADLAAIRDWGAAGLVSLVQEAELELLGVEDLAQRTRRHGMWWQHLPIRDMCAPGETFESRWQRAGDDLRRLATSGGRFVLHCWAGLGRTGTVAARLLVELGVPPDDAIARVREARPGAIQSLQQEIHVRRCRPVA